MSNLAEDRLGRPLNRYEIVNAAEVAINRREVELNARTGERPLTVQQRSDLLDAVRRAETAYGSVSLSCPAATSTDSAYTYTVRAVSGLQHHHPDWARVDLAAVARSNPVALGNIASAVYRAAVEHGNDPLDLWRPDRETRLRERVEVQGGTTVTTWHGSEKIALAPFTGGGRTLAVRSFGPRFAGRRS
jgi:hypothetical protein